MTLPNLSRRANSTGANSDTRQPPAAEAHSVAFQAPSAGGKAHRGSLAHVSLSSVKRLSRKLSGAGPKSKQPLAPEKDPMVVGRKLVEEYLAQHPPPTDSDTANNAVSKQQSQDTSTPTPSSSGASVVTTDQQKAGTKVRKSFRDFKQISRMFFSRRQSSCSSQTANSMPQHQNLSHTQSATTTTPKSAAKQRVKLFKRSETVFETSAEPSSTNDEA